MSPPRHVPVTTQDPDASRILGESRQVLDRSTDPSDRLTRGGAATKIKEASAEYYASQYIKRNFDVAEEITLPRRGTRRGRPGTGPPPLDRLYALRDGSPLVVEVKYEETFRSKPSLGRTSKERFEASETGEVVRRVTRRGLEQFEPEWFSNRLNELSSKRMRQGPLAERLRASWKQGKIVVLVIRVDNRGSIRVEDRTEQWRRYAQPRTPQPPPTGGTSPPVGSRSRRPRQDPSTDRGTAARVAGEAPAPRPAPAEGAPPSQTGRISSPTRRPPRLSRQTLSRLIRPIRGGRGVGGAADLLFSVMQAAALEQERRRAQRALASKLAAVERFRNEGYWVALRLVIERPIRTDLTGHDSRMRFACWQITYARSEAELHGGRVQTIRAAPSREEVRRGREAPCKPSRDDWELESYPPKVFPPYEAFADPDGFASFGTYQPVWSNFPPGSEPDDIRLRSLTIARLRTEGPLNFRLLDLRTGRPLLLQVLRRSETGVTLLITGEGPRGPRSLSESTFIPLTSERKGEFVAERYEEARGQRRSGLVLWQAVKSDQE